jgi:hypothetical protein
VSGTALAVDRPPFCPHCRRQVRPNHYYASGKTRCQNRLKWTWAMRFRLEDLVERGKTADQIAKALGVTRTAVIIAQKRYGLQNVQDASLSAREIAELMGIGCAKTVTKWIDRGFLRGRRLRYSRDLHHQPWFVRREWLDAFLADERAWHLWTPGRITDAALRCHADQVRGDVRFLTPREFAEMAFVQHSTVNQWIHKGWLPARRWGNWWIDSRVAAEWTHELGCSDMPNLEERRAEADALAVLRDAGERRAA